MGWRKRDMDLLLVDSKIYEPANTYLSITFATFCIVDMVGLFPVIALPRAIIDCGWLGLPLAIGVLSTEIYTAILLGKCWILSEKLDHSINLKKRCPYGAIVELAFGKKLSNYVKFILDLSIFGASISDLLIASQNLQIIGLKMSSYETNISYCYWLIIIGVSISPIMWFGSPKDLKIIGITSVSVVFLTSFLTWLSISSVNDVRVRIPEPSWESIGIAYGILAFQFDVHPMLLSVQMDMKNKRDISKAIILAFIMSGSICLITCLFCYLHLGDSVEYNTLQSLPQSFVLDLALCLSTIQVCLSMAMGSTSLFQDIEESLRIEPEFSWRRAGLRTGTVLLAVALGEAVPRAELLMGLVGGALTGQLMFLFPPLLYWRLRAMSSSTPGYGSIGTASTPAPDRTHHLVLVAVVAVGLAATFCSTYFAFRSTLQYAEFVPSCLINSTAASEFVSQV
nr:amino acid transporter AVT1G-like [Halyomorpha halys]